MPQEESIKGRETKMINLDNLLKSLNLFLDKLTDGDKVTATGILLGAIWALEEETKGKSNEKQN